jgi:drug/metabolite transporter (DMT)-like permease
MMAALGAASIWGGMYVVSKYVLAFLPPLTLVGLRLAIAAVVLSGLAAGSRAGLAPRSGLPRLLLCGVVGFGISLTAQFAGTRLSTAHDGALITSATPAFIALFAGWLLKERVTPWRWLAMAVATAGVIVVATDQLPDPAAALPSAGAPPATVPRDAGEAPLGNALLFVAAVTWALYTVLAKASMERDSPLIVTTYATYGGLLCVLPAVPLEWAALAPPDWGALPALAWWGMLYLGVVSTAVAFYLWNRAFETLDASLASLFFFAQPVVGSLLGWLLLDEHLSPRFFAGAAAIVAGVLLSSSAPTRT